MKPIIRQVTAECEEEYAWIVEDLQELSPNDFIEYFRDILKYAIERTVELNGDTKTTKGH